MNKNCAAADILIPNDEDDENNDERVNSFAQGISSLTDAGFKNFTDKTTNVTQENNKGIVRAKVLSEYVEKNFGYRYTILDVLIKEKINHAPSSDGWGMTKLIELVKSISATFEQTEIPEGMRGLLARR